MVLTVDDYPRFLATARDALGMDTQVFSAADATRALKLAENFHSLVVLIDMELGGENEFLLIEKLHQRFPHIAGDSDQRSILARYP